MSDADVQTHISSEMEAAVGAVIGRRVSYPVSASDIRRWGIAVHYPEQPPAHYWDEDAAAASPHGGLVAPLDFNPFAWLTREPGFNTSGGDDNDPDRTEKSLGIDGPGLEFMLNGGLQAAYGVRMRVADTVTSVNRLQGYRERTGRLGLMLFTTFEDTWTNQDDKVIKRSTMTLIRY